MKLTEAIDLFPTLKTVRAGVDADSVRSWLFDEHAFIDAASTHGSGAKACACFIVSIAGHHAPQSFTLAALFERIDTAHKAAALAVFAACLEKGGLQ